MEFLGTITKLQGFTGYRGGLDVRCIFFKIAFYYFLFFCCNNIFYKIANSTGEVSVYTTHKGFEIMFHVATMLPFQEQDEQKVERKRHIGNDVVCFLFLLYYIFLFDFCFIL